MSINSIKRRVFCLNTGVLNLLFVFYLKNKCINIRGNNVKLSDVLEKKNNNFELIRIVCACMVIIGHSGAITGEKEHTDLVAYILQFDYSGSLAVKFFFFLSGLVVTNSLMANPELWRFMIARIARIFPALAVVMSVSAWILGPVVTVLPVSQYFSDGDTFKYIYNNVFLHSNFNLPGAFWHNPRNAVNGSIWTIPMEFFCYTLLSICGALRLSTNKIVFSLVVAFMGVLILVWPDVLTLFQLPAE
jgi:peptidoglycan/LPS O-acetylase OafA/YrhL